MWRILTYVHISVGKNLQTSPMGDRFHSNSQMGAPTLKGVPTYYFGQNFLKKLHENYIYCPQRSCGKVMFLHLSVILFTEGVSDRPAWANTPLGSHPPQQTPPGQLNLATESVADPGFPRRGRVPTPGFWGKVLLFGKIFAENCMKMKEIGPGAHVPSAPLDQPVRM